MCRSVWDEILNERKRLYIKQIQKQQSNQQKLQHQSRVIWGHATDKCGNDRLQMRDHGQPFKSNDDHHHKNHHHNVNNHRDDKCNHHHHVNIAMEQPMCWGPGIGEPTLNAWAGSGQTIYNERSTGNGQKSAMLPQMSIPRPEGEHRLLEENWSRQCAHTRYLERSGSTITPSTQTTIPNASQWRGSTATNNNGVSRNKCNKTTHERGSRQNKVMDTDLPKREKGVQKSANDYRSQKSQQLPSCPNTQVRELENSAGNTERPNCAMGYDNRPEKQVP